MHFLKDKIQLDTRKGIAGLVLAVISLAICGLVQAWHIGVAFGAAFLTAGYIRIRPLRPLWTYLLLGLWVLTVAACTWLAPAAMVGATGQMTVTSARLLLNFLCIIIVCGTVFAITAKPRLAVILGSLLLLLLATANGFVYQFRGKELGSMDILSLKTALQVADQYRAQLSPEMVYRWLWWLLTVFAGFSLPALRGLPKWRCRLSALLSLAALVPTLQLASASTPIKTWDNEGTRLNGYYLNFYLGIRDASIQKPENYSAAVLETEAQKYIPASVSGAGEDLPNVLVIMEESLADFRVLGDLETNVPVTPFLDALTENTVRGYALTSVYGGNTANAEFEFLTGQSMAFLPDNSVPYQQYIGGDTYTLARVMQAYGYKSAATHPYLENGWSRSRIYPFFGFEESSFIEAYSTKHPVRDFVSDRDMFDFILKKLANENDEKPLFLFGITMQNHGGYDYSGEYFEKSVDLVGYNREYPIAEQYLSLLHETDAAIEHLLSALANSPEKTVVLIFGDHFPKVETEFYTELHGGTFDTLSDQMRQYTVPFYIWANFDIPEETVYCTSLNFLSCHLLKAAGLPLPPYHQFLSEMETVVPAMNAFGYYAPEKEDFISYDAAAGEEAAWLGRYAALQYNHLFDTKNRNTIFFGE